MLRKPQLEVLHKVGFIFKSYDNKLLVPTYNNIISCRCEKKGTILWKTCFISFYANGAEITPPSDRETLTS